MTDHLDELVSRIYDHRCFSHPIFEHWAQVNPSPSVLGALFHQIQCFCAATRPGWRFPMALAELGLTEESGLMQEIVESEEGHGAELATMAAFIVNQAAGQTMFEDLDDQDRIEAGLKVLSDYHLGSLPSYEEETGLTVQARKAIAVFDGRKRDGYRDTMRNLGVALALEIISHRHLIPGEKRCLVDAALYDVKLDQPEMHYLLEHWGEIGAEAQHETNVLEAARSLADKGATGSLEEGIDDFLDALCALWDVLDSALLQSGLTTHQERLAA